MQKILTAKFHQTVFIMGPGTLGDTLPGNKTFETLNLTAETFGLMIEAKVQGKPTGWALVPWANVVNLGLAAPEAPKAK